MRIHMVLQVMRLMKRLRTDRTLERPLLIVDRHMTLKVRLLVESVTTDCAGKGSLPRVYSSVPGRVIQRGCADTNIVRCSSQRLFNSAQLTV